MFLTLFQLLSQPVMMSPAQTQYQEQLQRKHEELQQMILQQQQELRRVSDQLLMARYGILPASLLNVNFHKEPNEFHVMSCAVC